jgi:hypothetical protein
MHTSGAPIPWVFTWSLGKSLKPTNSASQAFDPEVRSALNRAEYFGGDVWVTASGGYEELVS